MLDGPIEGLSISGARSTCPGASSVPKRDAKDAKAKNSRNLPKSESFLLRVCASPFPHSLSVFQGLILDYRWFVQLICHHESFQCK